MEIDILNTHVELENDRVLLLPFEHLRNEELKKVIFNDNIWEYMGMYVRNDQDFDHYKKSTLNAKKTGSCYPFIIIDKQSNRVAGSTRYGNINSASGKCEIGWTWYGKDFQGTGLNKACKFELLKFGFETLKLRRIQFSADLENLRSQRAIEKLGAQKEGIFRNNYIDSNGTSRNDVYYSIIKEEWNSVKATFFNEFT